jgi:hypothetical protein
LKNHQLNTKIKNKVKHYNVYTKDDLIQAFGGNSILLDDKNDKNQANYGEILYQWYHRGETEGTGEVGLAKRDFENAENIQYDDQYKFYDSSGCGISNHCGQTDKNVEEWAPKLDKLVNSD